MLYNPAPRCPSSLPRLSEDADVPRGVLRNVGGVWGVPALSHPSSQSEVRVSGMGGVWGDWGVQVCAGVV